MVTHRGMQELVRFVDAERSRLGLSERELAQRSGLDHSTVNRVLAMARAPSLETLQKLARGLGLDFYDFILAAAGYQDMGTSELLRAYRELDPSFQVMVLTFARQLAETQRP